MAGQLDPTEWVLVCDPWVSMLDFRFGEMVRIRVSDSFWREREWSGVHKICVPRDDDEVVRLRRLPVRVKPVPFKAVQVTPVEVIEILDSDSSDESVGIFNTNSDSDMDI